MRDGKSIRERISRRRYAQLLAAGGVAGLAGCGSDGDGGDGGGDGDGGDGDGGMDDTPTPTEGDGGAATDTPEQEETVPPESERRTDRIRIFVENTPDEFDRNPFAPQDNTGGTAYMSDLGALGEVNSDAYQGGRTFETPHHYARDEVEVQTWVTGFDIEAPYDHYNTHNEELTFWNGDPVDAEARNMRNLVGFHSTGGKFTEGEVHRGEATSQYEYHWWRSKGEVPGADDDPANTTVLTNTAQYVEGEEPIHPDWSLEWIERFESASTQESYDEEISNLRGDRVSLERMAENGWGYGPYELRGTDDIGSDRVLLRLRDEDADSPHPHHEHINVPILQLQLGASDRRSVLAGNGAIDLGGSQVSPNNTINSELLPDHMAEVSRYLQAGGGDSLWWNMNNVHLENLWVRRALVAIIDFEVAGTNGWGEQSSIPLDQYSGLLDTTASSTFSEEFLDSLYQYPINADEELATEWMQNAGYERQGGVWTSPQAGEATMDIQIPGINDWVGAAQTIREQLRQFGINATFTQHDWGTWSNNLDTVSNENAPNFDISVHWYGLTTPFGHYKSQAAWWDNGSIIGGSPEDQGPVDAEDEYTMLNQPVQAPLPTEVGDISAPTGTEAAPNNPPDLDGVTDFEMVNMGELLSGLQQPQDSEEALQQKFRTAAQYYNYYLPKFAFHQYVYGGWGNVRDLDFAPDGHPSLFWESTFDIRDVQALGGLAQASYDDELDR